MVEQLPLVTLGGKSGSKLAPSLAQVKGYIERKSMLYVTGVEYGDYTMNHVLGCSYGCKYPCYAFMMKKRFGQVASYEAWLEPYLVSNTLEILDREIPRLKSKITSVNLCFTTDPFMYGYDEIIQMSLAAIRKLNDADIKCTVLTKGLLPDVLSDYSVENEYGITLISLDEKFSERIEPGAASYRDRLAALRRLHDLGCKIWVSVEPYPTPNLITQDLNEILDAIAVTDKIIFGRTNYSKEVSAYTEHRDFYNEQAQIVIEFCDVHEIQYHIKDGTITELTKVGRAYGST
jgi:DNA repair photolyase